ncbi:unnamed protein product [Rotaria sordida]|uniref:Tc1-like transposase DDE domain-containing protein n=1 Tax=Rotaria sordida TaxID=392033 RepID=A0A815R6A0_9BILA|nr:unnamed protein product [Rotaria sordida]CAF1472510.1 unnamed protein product [Rotaria sordida]CAF1544744.1 unnamed protein product [Rotaria sordida]CAF3834248.1 unnamed protein product [Rotaria sordida]CAF4148145.1 unnamed protein product [Rotaria sordida]
MPHSTLAYTLHRLGYQFGHDHVISGHLLKDKTSSIRQFIIDYANALKADERGDSIIIYMHELYVNTRHALNGTWYDASTPIGNKLIRGTGKGARLIIVHAMTKYGLLHHSNKEDAIGVEKTAEMIWFADKANGNYHKNMDSANFLLWLHDHLFPTFQLLFSSKKMILVLDNASYHHARALDFIDPYKMNKSEVTEKLLFYNIDNIEVEREGKIRMDSSTYNKRGGSKAPTLVELQTALSNHLQNIGYVGKTEVQKLFESYGYTLIYTPPCMPQFQPIELIWTYVKRYVASQFKFGRSISELKQHTLQGLYGDSDKHIGVTSDLTLKVIENVHGVINRYIKEDIFLDGSIDKLIVKHPTLVTNNSDVINDQVNELDAFMGELEDEYEEQEKMEDEREP